MIRARVCSRRGQLPWKRRRRKVWPAGARVFMLLSLLSRSVLFCCSRTFATHGTLVARHRASAGLGFACWRAAVVVILLLVSVVGLWLG